jgi:hypothetical protein
VRQPDFDIDQKIGAQSELWVGDFCKALAMESVEVKAPKPFLEKQSAYIEFACKYRDGKWRKSGIATTKAKFYFLTFGSLPGGLAVETEWLKRAARLAFKLGLWKECVFGSNPTKAVLVSLTELHMTRERDP